MKKLLLIILLTITSLNVFAFEAQYEIHRINSDTVNTTLYLDLEDTICTIKILDKVIVIHNPKVDYYGESLLFKDENDLYILGIYPTLKKLQISTLYEKF